jgi:hypothetical protein
MSNAIDSMTADELRKLAAAKLRERDAQRTRAKKFRDNKALLHQRRLSVYVPAAVYDEARAAVANVIANWEASGNKYDSGGVTHSGTATENRAATKANARSRRAKLSNFLAAPVAELVERERSRKS